MTNPVKGSANGAQSTSVSEWQAPRMSKEEAQEEAQRMADALKKHRGFDVTFDGPDLTITGTDGEDSIFVGKLPDGTIRVQAATYEGHYDISPDVRNVTINAGGGDNLISVFPNVERPFTLIAAGGSNLLAGGGGNDTIIGNGETNNLSGGAGNDSLRARGSFNGFNGGTGDDWILGSNGEDSIQGGEGNDEIYAREGNDGIFGGDGDDIIFGEEGKDSLFGGPGRNQVHGGRGDDSVQVGDEQETIFGGPGNDRVDRLYPENTGREAAVFDNPDKGSTVDRAGDWFILPDIIYRERKE